MPYSLLYRGSYITAHNIIKDVHVCMQWHYFSDGMQSTSDIVAGIPPLTGKSRINQVMVH